MLLVASGLIALLPFRRVAALAARGSHRGAITAAEARAIERALARTARLIPWRTLCFEQGLAALIMLRRRGHQATLYYGARHDADHRLTAHIWIRSGGVAVTGCADLDGYALLARFPAAD